MIAAIDSYYAYVVQQMAIVDSAQKFGGLISARDWPQTQPIDSALYLLFLNAVPVGGTESQIKYQYFCQWNWLLIGNDIAANQQASNRGDRWRSSMKIAGNLRQANYPGFCQKTAFAVDAQGNFTATPVTSSVPYSQYEGVYWTKLKFIPRQDEKAGLIYGAASLQLYAYDDVLAAIA
jgi:hypothetical protein